jgi:hypothetical protein
MKLKKTMAGILAVVAAFGAMSIASCGGKKEGEDEKEGEDGKLGKVSFFELKEWFLNTYPEIQDKVNEAKKHSSKLLAEAKENAKRYQESKKKVAA